MYSCKVSFVCNGCECVTHTTNALLRHISTCAKLDSDTPDYRYTYTERITYIPNAYACHVCYKIFPSRRWVNEHTNTKGLCCGVPPNTCEHCKQSFANRQLWWKHAKVCKLKGID